jgi:hypothetical protein
VSPLASTWGGGDQADWSPLGGAGLWGGHRALGADLIILLLLRSRIIIMLVSRVLCGGSPLSPKRHFRGQRFPAEAY